VAGETCLAAERFRATYGSSPRLFRAPGRVNVIGEHTDYNEGFVMPSAVGLYTFVAVASRGDRKLVIFSEQFQQPVTLELDRFRDPLPKHWSNYVWGIAAVLDQSGYPVPGANLVIDSRVPIGSGLSSSAALEVGTGLALTSMMGATVPLLDLAKMCQRAENEYTGARCGIMDQYVSCFGRKDHVLLLDCRSLAATHIPLPPTVRLVICNTMTKHDIAAGEYNKRRASCEASVEAIRKVNLSVHSLRDVTPEDLEQYRDLLSDTDFRRCRHVTKENVRVLETGEALRHSDLVRAGELMYLSHESLDCDYEVSCAELNLMVDLARGFEGVYGARMTGGGFGGCTVNLVEAEAAPAFKNWIVSNYGDKTGLTPEVYICSAVDGAGAISE
jgi:galactokinase